MPKSSNPIQATGPCTCNGEALVPNTLTWAIVRPAGKKSYVQCRVCKNIWLTGAKYVGTLVRSCRVVK